MFHDDPVLNIAFSPDGRYLATASNDNTARVWDPASGNEVTRMPHDGPVTASLSVRMGGT